MNKLKQNGVALISILIIVAIVSGIVATMWERQHKNFERTQYIQAQQQALNYMYSAEGYFLNILKDKRENEKKACRYPLPSITASLKSAQSTMSLNNIVNAKNRNFSADHKSMFDCLTKPHRLSDFLIRYYDDNRHFKEFDTVEQLKNIKDIKKFFYKIKGNFNAREKDTKISINGAGKQMLQCLLRDTSIDEIGIKYIMERGNNKLGPKEPGPYNDLDEFFRDVKYRNGGNDISERVKRYIRKLAVADSRYFTVKTNMTIDKINFTGETIFKREGGTGKSKITILKRSFN